MTEQKALEWDANKGNLSLIQAPIPKATGRGQVVVKVAYSGVCGTDIHVMLKEFAAAENVGNIIDCYFKVEKCMIYE